MSGFSGGWRKAGWIVALIAMAVSVSGFVWAAYGGAPGKRYGSPGASEATGGGAEDASGRIKLVWVTYNKPEGERQAILARWRDKYPGIAVEYKDFPAEPPSYNQALDVAFADNETMDVVAIDPATVQNRAQQGVLYPLDGMAEREGFSLNGYFGEVLRSKQVAGKTYQLPYTYRVDVLYYNKDMFDAKGLPYPDENTTFAELVEMARQLQQGSGPDKVWGYMDRSPFQPALNAGWNWMRDDATPAFADQRVRQSLELHKALFDSGASPSYAQTKLDKLSAMMLFAQGKVAMFVEDWWPPVFWSMQKFNNGTLGNDALQFRYDAAFLPRYDASARPRLQQVEGDWGYGVNAKTKHPYEAYLFAKFLATETYDVLSTIPVHKSASAAVFHDTLNVFVDNGNRKHVNMYPAEFVNHIQDVVEQTIPLSSAYSTVSMEANVLTAMKEAYNREADAYFLGKIGIDELLDRVQQAGEQEVAAAKTRK